MATYAKSINLIKVADGASGSPGAPGRSWYTWIVYADDEKGNGISLSPEGKKYIGIASNQLNPSPSTDLESINKGIFAWSKYVGNDGKDGQDGQDGKDGKDGITLYTWIKYADDASGENMSDTPTGKKYMGIAHNKSTQEESSLASDYTWSLIQGADGADGTDGVDGKDGENGQDGKDGTSVEILSEEVRYALSESPTSRPTDWNSEMPTELPQGWYLWTRVVVTYTGDKSTTAYSVAYLGKDGKPGEKGDPGLDGEGINAYSLVSQQSAILKFIDKDNVYNVTISPNKLALYVKKEDATKTNGYEQIKNLSLSQLRIDLLDYSVGQWKNLSDIAPLGEFVVIDEDGNIFVDLETFYNLNYESIDENNALTSFRNNAGEISFTYILEDKEEDSDEIKTYNLFTSVSYRFNEPWEVLSFAQNANNITMALQDTGLVFDANGLSVLNGGFVIYDSKEKTNKLLYIENGNLNMVGNIHANSGYFKGEIEATSGSFTGTINATAGSFTGEVNATSGSFNGKIVATTGEIGGFIISDGYLTSKKTYVNANGVEQSSIKLDGENGTIVAQNIELGTGAKISDYIELGDGRIRLNSKKNGTEVLKFLSVKTSSEPNAQEVLSIADSGVITVGNGNDYIVIDGGKGSIESQSFGSGRGWQITNKESIFNDVTVRGSIKASVLEYGEIQTIGGAMLVRPSSRIKDIEESYTENGKQYTKIWVDEASSFVIPTADKNFAHYCVIKDLGSVYKVYKAPEADSNGNINEHSIILEGKVSTSFIGSPLTLLGKNGEVGIGINGSTVDGLLTPTSLSVFEFLEQTEDSGYSLEPHIILGKLPTGTKYGSAAGTYGLYAENVRLTGSLVTQLVNQGQAPVYSGISTQYTGSEAPTSERYKKYFENQSFGEILIWAGASGDSKEQIELSKFFVDRMGNLYAGSGYFNGTIITDAKITASEIETAKIKGSGTIPALLIEDTLNGIRFEGTKDGVKKTSFEVGYSNFVVDVDSISFNKYIKIDNQGQLVAPRGYFFSGENGVLLDGAQIGFTNKFIEDNPWSSGLISSIKHLEGLEFYGDNSATPAMKINAQRIEANLTRFNEDVEYGENGEVKYRPAKEGNVIIGYDIFVG